MEVLRVDAESGEERGLISVLHGGQVLFFFTNMNPTITCLFETVLASQWLTVRSSINSERIAILSWRLSYSFRSSNAFVVLRDILS